VTGGEIGAAAEPGAPSAAIRVRVDREGLRTTLTIDGQPAMDADSVWSARETAALALKLHRFAASVHACAPAPRLQVLVAGLGFACSLQAVLESSAVGSVVVVEKLREVSEAAACGQFGEGARQALADPRVCLFHADIASFLRGLDPARDGTFDVVVMDVDNGTRLLLPGNAWLYTDDGFRAMSRALAPGAGVLVVWYGETEPDVRRVGDLRESGDEGAPPAFWLAGRAGVPWREGDAPLCNLLVAVRAPAPPHRATLR
jgi:spermidine synthase